MMAQPSDSSASLRGGDASAIEDAALDPELAEDVDDAVADEHTGDRRHWLIGLAAVVGLASLLGPIASSGIWDPHELKVADFARRIALTLLGATDLALEGAKNSVPTQGELARGQLPFQSVAVGFKLFGLHEWAGRLPLAIWGIVALLATYALVSRLADRVAGALSVLVLATMPLFFLHSRTILGDVVTMACIALATAGLSLAVFDRPSAGHPSGVVRRVLWLMVGLLGLAGGGIGARGLLIGVVVPALGVGLAWAISRSASDTEGDRLGDTCGGLTLAIGAGAAYLGVRALVRATPEQFSMLVGAAVNAKRQLPTYDFVIHYLGHGLFPWSAVLPFAVGRMLRPPPGRTGVALEREACLRITLVTVSAIGLAVYGAMAPKVGHLAFGPVFALAGIVAVAIRDFERGAPGSRAMAMGVGAFAILFYVDFKNFPEKGLSAFSVDDAKFPESFKELGTRIIKYGAVAFSGLFFFSVMERQREVGKKWFDVQEVLRWPRNLRTAFKGNLMFGFLVIVAALTGFSALNYVSDRYFHWKQFESMSPLAELVAKYGWYGFPLAVLLVPPLVTVARDGVRAFYRVVPVSRGVGATLSGVALGAVMSLWYYPALAAQISPKDVFIAYRELSAPGEPLAMMGAGAGSARYYAGKDVPTHASVNVAFNWLMERGQERRWLVIRSKDLPQMNSMYRGKSKPRTNLPVLDARSSEILLVSNQLGQGEENKNPFAKWLLDRAPNPANRTNGNFANQLESVGWEVTDLDDRVVDSVEPGVKYRFRIYYRVDKKISGNWETFIHIDGFQRRFNGDHKTLEGKYPLHLWLPGDYVADVHTFSLEPNFTPGNYRVFYGLFIGSRRLEVKRGRHSENRLDVGTLRVK